MRYSLQFTLVATLSLSLAVSPAFSGQNDSGKAKSGRESAAPRDLPWTSDEIPESLRAYDEAARTGDDVDLVLNYLEIARGAHLLGRLDLAKQAYDAALDRIDTVDAKSKTAERARSQFVPESEKTFKGEPYERSMAFFYRGVLAAQQGDYELARACFRSASFYDSSAAEEYEGDYVIHYWMEAKMDQLLGEVDRARGVYRWAAESAELVDLKPNPIPSMEPSANLILIVEAGSSPVKTGAGPYGAELSFDPPLSPPPAGGIGLELNGTILTRLETPTEDVYAQALSRGRRMADRINRGKASFKSFTDAMGTGATIAGAGVMAGSRRSSDAAIGAGIMVLGLLAKGISESTRPEADLRYWRSLPAHIFIIPLKVDGAADLIVRGFDAAGNSIHETAIHVDPAAEDFNLFRLVPIP